MKYLIVLCAISLAGCTSMVEKAFKRGRYARIINTYDEPAAKYSARENFLVAESYRRSNRPALSEPYYSAFISQAPPSAESLYLYAQVLKAVGKYELALQALKEGLQKPPVDAQLAGAIQSELSNLLNLQELENTKTFYKVKNLLAVNTPHAEYGPVYHSNYLYFTSNRDGKRICESTGVPYTDLYRIKGQGTKAAANTLELLPGKLNVWNINEGGITFSRGGNYVIYGRGNTGRVSGANNVDLYYSRKRFGKWSEPQPLGINRPEAWDSTPLLSSNTTLLFSSNREGGYGGTDLYSARLNPRGRWMDVRNLGPEINTFGDEMFPFYSGDGSLYFASDGHPGFGGLDMFRATRSGGEVVIENLLKPLNSSGDDFGYFEYSITKGYFSTNREGGKGDDDIFLFVNDDPDLKIINYFLDGVTVTTREDEDGGKQEHILGRTKILMKDKDENVVDEMYTSLDGKFRLRVFPEEDYSILAEKNGFFNTRKAFSTIGKSVDKSTLTEFSTDVEFSIKIHLDPIILEKPIVLDNIYYDLDKADIRLDAGLALDSLVTVVRDNPGIFIELGSHTDSRADNAYNLDLSRRRAVSAVAYLIDNGIEAHRLLARGYGETELLVPDARNELEHQTNRRTEFRVLRYNPRKEEDFEDEQEEGEEGVDTPNQQTTDVPGVGEEIDPTNYDRFFINATDDPEGPEAEEE